MEWVWLTGKGRGGFVEGFWQKKGKELGRGGWGIEVSLRDVKVTPKPLSLVTLSSGSGGDREEEEGVAGGEEVGNSGFWDRSLTLWFALKVKVAHIGSALKVW